MPEESPSSPRRRTSRRGAWLDALLWALAFAPLSVLAQLVALVLVCRVRSGTWPRPYVPDVDSVALPGQHLLYVLTSMAALYSVLAVPCFANYRRVTARRPMWPNVLVNLVGFALMMWVMRGDPGGLGLSDWAWD